MLKHLNFTKIFTGFAIASISIFLFSQSFPLANAAIGINRQINFQGKLVNNPAATNVTDTSYTVIFTLYDNASGGTQLWQETQSVTTVDGIFRVALGSVTPFPANFNFNWSGLYLGMKVNSDSEMTPRIQMAAVPFAFNAEKVAGLTVQDDSGVGSTSGTLRIGNSKTITFAGSNALTFNDPGSSATITFPTTGAITLVDTGTSQTLTNKIIGSTGLTFSGATTDITTASNEDLTLSANGTGTLNVLSNSGGQAALIINKTGNLDIFTASASGVTKFALKNDGTIVAPNYSSCLLTTDANGQVSCGQAAASGAATLLAIQSYASGTDVQWGPDISTSLTDVDTTNGAVTFTAPASGKVLVKTSVLTAVIGNTWTVYFGLREGSTTVKEAQVESQISYYGRRDASFLITGLTPGSVHTYKFAMRSSGNYARAYTGPSAGQFVMEVWDPSPVSTALASNYYKRTSGDYTTSSGTFTNIDGTNLAQTVTLATTGKVHAKLQGLAALSVVGTVNIDLLVDGVSQGGTEGVWSWSNAGGGGYVSEVSIDIPITNLSAGSHTFTWKWKRTSGTATLYASSNTPLFASIEQIPDTQLASGNNGVNSPFVQNDSIASIYQLNNTVDLLLGGSSTTAAKFGFLNNAMARGSQVASVSGSLVLDSSSASVQSTNFQNLVLGGSTTGQLVLKGFNGAVNGITFSGYNTCTLKTDSNGVVTCGTDNTGVGTSPFTENTALGTIFENNNTEDFLIGGNSTATAKFAILGVATSTPVASVAGNLVLGSAAGTTRTIGSTAMNALQLGDSNTGSVQFFGSSNSITSAGKLTINNDLILGGASTEILTSAASSNLFVSTNDSNGTLYLNSWGMGFGDGPIVTGAGLTTLGGAASVSGSLTFKSGLASIQSTAFTTLTLGGSTTGQVVLSGFNGAVNAITFTGYNTCTLKTTSAGVVTCGTDNTGSGVNWWNQLAGALSPVDTTNDLLLGSTATSSALFSYTGLKTGQTIASASGNLIVMPNNGWGGKVGIGTTDPLRKLDIAGAVPDAYDSQLFSVNSTTNNFRTLLNGENVIIRNESTSGGWARGFILENSSNSPQFVLGGYGSGQTYSYTWLGTAYNSPWITFMPSGTIGIGTTSPLATFDVRYANGTLSVASISGQTSFATLVANNDGVGDLFTASSSGTNKFSIARTGQITAPLYNNCTLKTDGSGLFTCGTDNTGSGVNWWNQLAGALSPIDINNDLLIGGTSTSSALFSYTGIKTGQTIASASGNLIVMANNGWGGQVGIGTITPKSLLHIDGVTPKLTLSSTNTSPVNGTLFGQIMGRSTFYDQDLASINIEADSTFSGGVYPTRITFSTMKTSVSLERMRIDSLGNVGIRTTTPVASLHVSGAYGSNAAVIVDQLNNGDILAASASGTTKFVISNTGAVTIGNSTDGLVFSPTTANNSVYSGAARPTKTITLSPEYAGAVLTASGSATTNGSMTSDASPSANFRTYYEWTSTQASLNDYTVAVRVTLPQDFGAWVTGNSITVNFNTASTNNTTNKLDVYVYNPSSSTTTPVTYKLSNVSGTDKTWTNVNITDTELNNGITWNTAGQTATFYLKMYASGTYNYTQIGNIVLNYKAKF